MCCRLDICVCSNLSQRVYEFEEPLWIRPFWWRVDGVQECIPGPLRPRLWRLWWHRFMAKVLRRKRWAIDVGWRWPLNPTPQTSKFPRFSVELSKFDQFRQNVGSAFWQIPTHLPPEEPEAIPSFYFLPFRSPLNQICESNRTRLLTDLPETTRPEAVDFSPGCSMVLARKHKHTRQGKKRFISTNIVPARMTGWLCQEIGVKKIAYI